MKVIQQYSFNLKQSSNKNKLPRGSKPIKIVLGDPPEYMIEGAKSIPVIRVVKD